MDKNSLVKFVKINFPILFFMQFIDDGASEQHCGGPSGGEGGKKTKGTKRSMRWCFTSFKDDFSPDPTAFRFLCYQREICPSTGRPHWQGYCELNKQLRLGSVQELLGDPVVNCRIARGNAQENRDYCSKSESKVDGTYVEFGTPARSGKPTQQVVEMVKEGKSNLEIIDELPSALIHIKKMNEYRFEVYKEKANHWRDVSVFVYWGETGSGKTRRVYDTYGYEHVFKLSIHDHACWFDGYVDQKVLLIDDFYGQIQFFFLLQLLDGYPMRLPIKGGHAWALFDTICITSNSHPNDWYPNVIGERRNALQRRFKKIEEMKN